MKKCLIIGASGLIGKNVLQLLLADAQYGEVIALVRNPLRIKHEKLTEVEVDFNALDSYVDTMAVADVFCCLGTTLKKAGSKESFRKVDFDIPYSLAKNALKKGAKHFVLVSSMGADLQSPFFYNKLKGELEEAIGGLGFQKFSILRPSLLLGERPEKRFLEELGQKSVFLWSWLLMGKLKAYRPIAAVKVANFMVKSTTFKNDGKRIYLSDEIERSAVDK